ncbi:GTPase HflX [bacterium]|nr:GTPase HflX [bacterium]MCI0603183.1 GTPase HflX [bacterium]
MHKKTHLTNLLPPKEKAVAVGIYTRRSGKWKEEQSLEELSTLAVTAGADVKKMYLQEKPRMDPAYYCGKGKLEEIKEFCDGHDIDVVLFDDPLSPAQMRNIEKLLDRKVLDRTQLILDIFAQRAKTSEGKLQVELAQIDYLLPRLTGKGMMLSRLGGGIGTRGPGETKLEFDRRRLRERRTRLLKQLEHVKQIRQLQRSSRSEIPLPIVALIGYTNAGKTTLFNRLTGSKGLASPILFATLDPAMKSIRAANKQLILISDTVGFIQKIPHELIAAFRATLEEVIQAHVLLHVIDASNPNVDEQIEAVSQTIRELGVDHKPVLHVLNKIDLLENDASMLQSFRNRLGEVVAISAETGEGLEELVEAIANTLKAFWQRVQLSIPLQEQSLIAQLHHQGKVYGKNYTDGHVELDVEVPKKLAEKLRHYAHS